MKITVTGSSGLLGWHAASRIHALNCVARFKGEKPPHELASIDRSIFCDPGALSEALSGADVILHFAGVNRGDADHVEAANPQIARDLVAACRCAGIAPHIVYANSIHALSDTHYGRSKRIAGAILSEFVPHFTELVLPHIFGECARPYYNNVTATLIDQIWKEEQPTLNPEGRVRLLHAGAAAQRAIDAALARETGRIDPAGRHIMIAELYELLLGYHRLYQKNIFPDLTDPFELALFNSYRTAAYPEHYPRPLEVNEDHRGMLFESAKGGNAPHTFLSTTLPGETRGNHFHFDLVERFVVVKGEAVIRIRKVLTDEVREFRVNGEQPVAIDQIPLHTHNIENLGNDDLITFFWSHRMFDPANPDTYADSV